MNPFRRRKPSPGGIDDIAAVVFHHAGQYAFIQDQGDGKILPLTVIVGEDPGSVGRRVRQVLREMDIVPEAISLSSTDATLRPVLDLHVRLVVVDLSEVEFIRIMKGRFAPISMTRLLAEKAGNLFFDLLSRHLAPAPAVA